LLTRAASELNSLPAGSAIEEMLADYQVMGDQRLPPITSIAPLRWKALGRDCMPWRNC
jgi:hypothetical protein